MAWSSPPTFGDGTILSATKLRTISQDLAHLYGLLNMPQAASCSLYNNTGLSSANNSWWFRHKGQAYLHYHAYVQSNTCTSFQIVVNGTSVFLDSTTRSAGYTYSGSVSITSLSLTSGDVYNAYLNVTLGSLSAIRIGYLLISEASTL